MNKIDKRLLGGLGEEEFVAATVQDYERRREERKHRELQWRLNMNFVAGNQYCVISPRGEIAREFEDFSWRERAVYNHLAPILETRLAKLSRVRPRMSVVPASGSDEDMLTARTATQILDSTTARLGLDDLLNAATAWSETCGTAFYQITWADDDVAVDAISPFEIFPDSDTRLRVEDCASVIHAFCCGTEEVRELYGLEVVGRDMDVFSPDVGSGLSGGKDQSARHNQALIVEYYERPSKTFPDGRMAIIAEKVLVHLSALPYKNGASGERSFPFVQQVAVRRAGCLWGASVVERAIPVQRAFNAVKNRKHEFLNRLSSGVLTVEDGSVDADTLTSDGLTPGKIIVYRQGATPPRFLDNGRLPAELAQEEDKLLSEFIAISGVSEIMRSSSTAHSVNSGVALQLLVEQDDTRLAVTAEEVKSAIRRVAAHILRLYKQFATAKRLTRVVGIDGEVEQKAWSASDITSDDVVFVTENQLSSTPAQKQQFVFDLLKTGLLQDENGGLDNRTRSRLLEMIGFGVWDDAGKDVDSLHRKRALKENTEAVLEVKQYDDHGVHIAEHTKFLLGGTFAAMAKSNAKLEEMIVNHIAQHKIFEAAAMRETLSAASENKNNLEGQNGTVDGKI